MSVLIKGMEMPKSCAECRFYGEYCWAKGDENRYSKLPCPLVPIPPHGDLIDRDDLSKRLNKLCDRVCQYSKAQRSVMCGACPLGDGFIVVEDDAPTIIEAEEGET